MKCCACTSLHCPQVVKDTQLWSNSIKGPKIAVVVHHCMKKMTFGDPLNLFDCIISWTTLIRALASEQDAIKQDAATGKNGRLFTAARGWWGKQEATGGD